MRARSAAARERAVVVVVLRVDAKTLARERLPERALVRACVPVRVGLDPRVARGEEGGVARLERERVEEEVEEDCVAAGRAGRVGSPAPSGKSYGITRSLALT